MIYLHKSNRNRKSKLSTILTRTIWRKRTKHYLLHTGNGKINSSKFIILDAPAGFGKTYAIKELLNSRFDNTVSIIPCETLIEILLCHIADNSAQENWLIKYLSDTKFFVVENIDIDLLGKKVTQKEIANALIKVLNNGITVIVTGINIKKKLPQFYKRITFQPNYAIVNLQAYK